MSIHLQVLKLHSTAIVPTRGSERASGLDLYALEDVKLYAGETKLIKTGIAFGIPEGYEVQIRPRSGLSLKTPLRVSNSPGTIDADYTGECCISMWHSGTNGPIIVRQGDRIAQAVLCPVVIPELVCVESLDVTVRGSSGFGSTGK